MESIDYEQEEQIVSENSKQQLKIKRFKEYLVSSGTVQHFVKFLFGLRTKQQHDEGVPNTDALDMFQDYFGALTPDTTEQQELKKSIAAAKAENADLSRDLEEVRRAIQSKREQMEKAREEKRLREEEEAKNPKKGGKK